MDTNKSNGWENEPDLDRLRLAHAQLTSNTEAGIQELSQLAELGSPMAMVYLGNIYRNGIGVERNIETARRWFERACDLGSLIGIFNLGCLNYSVKKYSEAEKLFIEGAERKYIPSVYWLARIYYDKPPGWGRLWEARILLEEAQSCGHIWARRELATLYIRGIYGLSLIPRGIWLFFSGAKLFYLEHLRDPKSQKLRRDGAENF